MHVRGRTAAGGFVLLAIGVFSFACATEGPGEGDTLGDGGGVTTAKDAGGSGSSGASSSSGTSSNGASSSSGTSSGGDDATGGDDSSPVGCDALSCSTGCCDSTGMCQGGTDPGVCGTAGAACTDCTTSGGTCSSGTCSGGVERNFQWHFERHFERHFEQLHVRLELHQQVHPGDAVLQVGWHRHRMRRNGRPLPLLIVPAFPSQSPRGAACSLWHRHR